MKLILKIAVGIVIAMVVLAVGCSVLIASSTDEIDKAVRDMGTGTVKVYAPAGKEWSGSIGSATRDGRGNATFRIEDDLAVVAVVQKRTSGRWTLRVTVLQDGELEDDQNTSAEFGVVTVSSS